MGCNCRGSTYSPRTNAAQTVRAALGVPLSAAQLTSPAKNKCYFVEIQGDYLTLSAHDGQVFLAIPGQSTQQEVVSFLGSCPQSSKTNMLVALVSALYAKPDAAERIAKLSGINFTLSYLKTQVTL